MTRGGCVQFGIAVRYLRPEAVILYDHNHALVQLDGKTFDVYGEKEPNAYHDPIRPEHGPHVWERSLKLRPAARDYETIRLLNAVRKVVKEAPDDDSDPKPPDLTDAVDDMDMRLRHESG